MDQGRNVRASLAAEPEIDFSHLLTAVPDALFREPALLITDLI